MKKLKMKQFHAYFLHTYNLCILDYRSRWCFDLLVDTKQHHYHSAQVQKLATCHSSVCSHVHNLNDKCNLEQNLVKGGMVQGD
jgi:hypothetical protein